MEEENEQEKDRHLYFIGPDAWMAVKLMLQLSRGGRKGRGRAKRYKKEEGGRSEKEMPKKKKENGKR